MRAVLHGMLLLLGLVPLVIAARSAVGMSGFVAHARSAVGIVARLNAGGSHPQIEFRTDLGLRVNYAQGGMVAGFRQGESVRVLYDENDPARSARVMTFGALWGDSVLWCVLGSLLVTVVAASWVGWLPPGSIFVRGR